MVMGETEIQKGQLASGRASKHWPSKSSCGSLGATSVQQEDLKGRVGRGSIKAPSLYSNVHSLPISFLLNFLTGKTTLFCR